MAAYVAPRRCAPAQVLQQQQLVVASGGSPSVPR